MQITTLSKWFVLGTALVLAGFFAFVFTVNEPAVHEIRFLVVNESQETATIGVYISGEEVFTQSVDAPVSNDTYDGRQVAAFNAGVTGREFILEAEVGEKGIVRRSLVDVASGEHIAIIYWGDTLSFNQSRQPFTIGE